MEISRKITDIQNDTKPLVIGSKELLYSGASLVEINMIGIKKYEKLIHDLKVSSRSLYVMTEIIKIGKKKIAYKK